MIEKEFNIKKFQAQPINCHSCNKNEVTTEIVMPLTRYDNNELKISDYHLYFCEECANKLANLFK